MSEPPVVKIHFQELVASTGTIPLSEEVYADFLDYCRVRHAGQPGRAALVEFLNRNAEVWIDQVSPREEVTGILDREVTDALIEFPTEGADRNAPTPVFP